MIDNFAPQPYPLECSSGGDVWHLVIGWTRSPDGRFMPVTTPLAAGPIAAIDPSNLRYRQAAPPTSTLRVSPTAAPSPAAEAIRDAAARPARRPQAT